MSNPPYRRGGRPSGNPNRRGGANHSQPNGTGSGSRDRQGGGHGGGRGSGRDGTPPRGPRGNNGRGGRGDRGDGSSRDDRGGRGDGGGRPPRGGGRIDKPGQRGRERPGRGGGIRTDRDGDIGMGEPQITKIQAAINAGSNVNILSPVDIAMAGAEDKRRGRRGDEIPIIVSGWVNSHASGNSDGGKQSLITWLERKTALQEATPLRLKNPKREGDDLIFWVKEKDAPRLLHLNNYQWAGVKLQIRQEETTGNVEQPTSQGARDAKSQMEEFLHSRYLVGDLLLNLAAMEQDPIIRQMGVTDVTSDTAKSKFFPALMKVCDLHFDNAENKRKAVPSVSLTNNSLASVAPVTTLAQTFPDLKNLDLSNNQITDVKNLISWRWKFRHLDHLVLTGNPIESTDYKETLLRWFPKLRLINGQVVRSPREIAAGFTKLPLAILAADFRDEAGIAETFIKNFFPLFDTDRPAIANAYYDNDSTFSLSVNTSAPRASDAEVRGVGWDPYIKQSRNLLKITHLPSRLTRAYTGVAAIREIWHNLPKTKHPDLLADIAKWCIECHSIPGLPDPSDPSAGGVGGLVITVHGQFEELTPTDRQHLTQRSFDRTFVLGPGNTPAGVRVISDIICLRAWGGFEAWLPNPDGSYAPAHPEASNGLGMPGMDKSTEQVMMEKMVLELSQKTNLNLQFARLCLESAQWNPDRAMGNFRQNMDSLGPEAWI